MQPMLRGAAPMAGSIGYVITPNDIDTLVGLSEAHGIDPTDVAVVLYVESAGFNPTSLGPGGAGNYTGLNQMSVANLATYGITPSDWVTWSAAKQLPVIFKFWQGLGTSFNGGAFPQNAGVLGALNILPGRYKPGNPNAPLASNPDIYYTKNTYYDPKGTGSISVNTIQERMSMIKASTAPRWKQIESMIGSVSPTPGPSPAPAPSNPSVLVVLAGGLALGTAAHLLMPHPPKRRARRRRYA
jgi:hypothetical protein